MGVVSMRFYLGVSVKVNRYIYIPRFSMNTQCEALYMIKTGWYRDEVRFIFFPFSFQNAQSSCVVVVHSPPAGLKLQQTA